MKLLLINQSSVAMPRQFLTAWLRKIRLKLKGRHPQVMKRELIIVFVDPDEMARMNELYRGKAYATDVLSFEPAEPDSLGELVICPQVVYEQSARTGLSRREELAFMVLHGVLHLLGYDHETSKRDEAKMFALQEKIFSECR